MNGFTQCIDDEKTKLQEEADAKKKEDDEAAAAAETLKTAKDAATAFHDSIKERDDHSKFSDECGANFKKGNDEDDAAAFDTYVECATKLKTKLDAAKKENKGDANGGKVKGNEGEGNTKEEEAEKKNNGIIFGVVALVVVGAVLFWVCKPKKDDDENNTEGGDVELYYTKSSEKSLI